MDRGDSTSFACPCPCPPAASFFNLPLTEFMRLSTSGGPTLFVLPCFCYPPPPLYSCIISNSVSFGSTHGECRVMSELKGYCGPWLSLYYSKHCAATFAFRSRIREFLAAISLISYFSYIASLICGNSLCVLIEALLFSDGWNGVNAEFIAWFTISTSGYRADDISVLLCLCILVAVAAAGG